MHKILWTFFEKWGTPEEARDADKSEIAALMQPLGLYEKRAEIIKRFSG